MTKEIHIFDLDDTLLITPTFADMFLRGGDERLDGFIEQVKRVFSLFMKKEVTLAVQGSFIVIKDAATDLNISSSDLNTMDERLRFYELSLSPDEFKKQFGISKSSIKDIVKQLEGRDGSIIVRQVRGFHANPETIGSICNPEVEGAYHSAQNKMILTGRGEKLESIIEARLVELGLSYPNHGLYCYPESSNSGIESFKISVIISTIEAEKWNKVSFYEDRLDWLEAAGNEVNAKYPDVEFIKRHISNVHAARSL